VVTRLTVAGTIRKDGLGPDSGMKQAPMMQEREVIAGSRGRR
jgi:hypothetical protein